LSLEPTVTLFSVEKPSAVEIKPSASRKHQYSWKNKKILNGRRKLFSGSLIAIK
jgi:hypothetical protein